METSASLSVLLDGYRHTALLYVAARLGLPDLLAERPQKAVDLARQLALHAPSLHRVLRALTALGICDEREDESFCLTLLGAGLKTGAADSFMERTILAGEEYMQAWGHLLHSLKTGEPAFDRAFGMSPWEHREQNPELGKNFDAWIRAESASYASVILSAYDFSHFPVIADLGGGHAGLLSAILTAHPSVSGILFDRPHVIAEARICLDAAGLSNRCQCAEGDFFEEVPAAADLYILKSILHDWPDDRALALLKVCRKAMRSTDRLLLIERLSPGRPQEAPEIVLQDIHMLAVTGGRERTKQELWCLLQSADLFPLRTLPTPCGLHIIEAKSDESDRSDRSDESD